MKNLMKELYEAIMESDEEGMVTDKEDIYDHGRDDDDNEGVDGC